MKLRKHRKRVSKRALQTQSSVQRLPPSADAARDEGPRLLPLGDATSHEPSRLEHYLDLADLALGTEKNNRG
ncbi:MAG TPA: hypothetical protein VOA64_05270 [Candidatus Dormibacteraeota bacterium]|nr:hypothetical protein [Candidatus Dormibacteraeota bacterium]